MRQVIQNLITPTTLVFLSMQNEQTSYMCETSLINNLLFNNLCIPSMQRRRLEMDVCLNIPDESLTVDKEFSRLHSFEGEAGTGFSKQVHIQKSERVRNE
jgi:hypothetical protein